jgi:hypothetical protein
VNWLILCLMAQLWRWRGRWHVRCVLKRMLPMSRSSGAEGRPKVGFLRCKNYCCTCCNCDTLLRSPLKVPVVVNIT